MDVRDVRFLFVFHANQRCREASDLWLFGDHKRDRLKAEPDPVVIERPERRTLGSHLVVIGAVVARHRRAILMCEHVDHACNGKRLASVDARDAPLAIVDGNDTGMGEAGDFELAGIFRGAGDLGAAIDAGRGGADISRHGPARLIFQLRRDRDLPRAVGAGATSQRPQRDRALEHAATADIARRHGSPAHRIFLSDCDCGVPAAACVSARTTARRARSILKALCSNPWRRAAAGRRHGRTSPDRQLAPAALPRPPGRATACARRRRAPDEPP